MVRETCEGVHNAPQRNQNIQKISTENKRPIDNFSPNFAHNHHKTNRIDESTNMNSHKNDKNNTIELNDLIGQFGFYQLNVMLFNLIRETFNGMDSMSFSLSLPAHVNFRCISSETSYSSNESRVPNSNHSAPCDKWEYYDPQFKDTLTVKFDLVCHREWLGSMVLTSFFFGELFGCLFWGFAADRYGRWKSHAVCHLMAFAFSLACVFAQNIYWLALFRFMSSFSSIGYYVLNSLQIEIIGIKYRTFTTTANHLGWGLGVVLLAPLGLATNNWHYLASITPIVTLLGLPWLLILPESIRWLILHAKYDEARKEIKRAAKYNFMPAREDMDKQINEFLNEKHSEHDEDQEEASLMSLFKNRTLCFNLVSLWLAFLLVGYIYFSRTLHFAPDPVAMVANFLIAGAGEWLCLIVAAACMYLLKRKTCLAMFISISGISILIEGCLATTTDLLNSSPSLVYVLDGFAKVSALSGIMVLLLVSYEVFPTELRHRGASIIFTALTIGSMIASFSVYIEGFVRGQFYYSIIIAVYAFMSSLFLVFVVSETKDMAISDTIEETKAQVRKKPNNTSLQ